ncbi:hypothetical protein HK100_012342 [Physocladia obscura]|uniref:Uncharacterized protein n=1 Tax=Physocladia obscura TaxID=109957 RepID=A0AAD5T2P6_9FUNG|nr:hypothetical protein HK100_012342 [Physocladia obscura]
MDSQNQIETATVEVIELNGLATHSTNTTDSVEENRTSSVNRTETPPPEYEGVIPTGLSLLAATKIDFDMPPMEYFGTVLPTRLEGKISNVTYATRMTALNHMLGTPEMQRSIWICTYYTYFATVSATLSVAVAVVGYVTFSDQGFFFLLLVGGAILQFRWGSAKVFFDKCYLLRIIYYAMQYTRKSDELVATWTKEDEALGLCLIWKIKRTLTKGYRTRICITVCAFERVQFEGDPVIQNEEALPVYSA